MRHPLLVVCGFAVAPFLAGCGESPGLSRTCSGIAIDAASLVLLSTFQVSGLGRIDADGCLTEVPDIALGTDPALAGGRNDVFVVARDDQLVHEVHADSLSFGRTFVPYEDAELDETHVLACNQAVKGTNPQDADIDADGRLWVTRWDKPTVAIVESDGSFSGKVDLSMFADADGLPEASAVRIVGDRAYVTIERIDRCGGYEPSGPGIIVEIDVATRQVVKSIELGGANPFGRMTAAPWDASGSTIAVALPGRFLEIDDGDAAAMVDLKGGNVVGFGRETELGGSVTEVVLAAPDEAYMIVSNTDNPDINATHVVRIDPQTGQVASTLIDSRGSDMPDGGFCHMGLAVVGERILVGSRPPCETGVVVFERQTGQQLGVIRPSNLPPIALQAVP
ncbi:MAG: hypothetical protein IPM54_31570 [Polyangiaceae bacterium]|nr:hypothetical protein [Polyangiaceae bacterium]